VALAGRVLYFGLHTVTDTPVEIPDRAAFRAAEVCEIVQIPPYVLRSWEKEFPGLGAAARPGGPRIYRRSDVEQILRIKQLVFVEGLTLAGVRHRIAGDLAEEAEAPIELGTLAVPAEVRNRVGEARRELRALLEMLSGGPAGVETRPTDEAAATTSAVAAPDADRADLPLLDGVLDTPPKRRRARRAAKLAAGGDATEVK
jgi:DNA-binding transcriptional MerR regulator